MQFTTFFSNYQTGRCRYLVPFLKRTHNARCLSHRPYAVCATSCWKSTAYQDKPFPQRKRFTSTCNQDQSTPVSWVAHRWISPSVHTIVGDTFPNADPASLRGRFGKRTQWRCRKRHSHALRPCACDDEIRLWFLNQLILSTKWSAYV